jgi:hypothetical protein
MTLREVVEESQLIGRGGFVFGVLDMRVAFESEIENRPA